MELGASLELPGGKVFNSAGMKGLISPSVPNKISQPPPQPEWLQQLLTRLVDNSVIEAPPEKSVGWSFVFIRNPDGTIKSITANPQE